MVNKEAWSAIIDELKDKGATLVAVSKVKPASDVMELYEAGQRDFGENYVQELEDKFAALPRDIRWHFIGHLQTNKVKAIAPFVHLVHAVDSFKLLREISRQAERNNRVIDVLLQIHIADEETKFGLDEAEAIQLLEECTANKGQLLHVRVCGLMGMATFTNDQDKVRAEFRKLHTFFRQLADGIFKDQPCFSVLSMGMTADYKIALEEGATLVRIGSMIFGKRR